MQRLFFRLLVATLTLALLVSVPSIAQVEDPNSDDLQAEDPNSDDLQAEDPNLDDPNHKKKRGGDHKKKHGGGDGGLVAFDLGDTQNESGNIETENNFAIEGNNNNACLGQEQFDQTGNFTNQQGDLQYVSEGDDFEFGGPESEFAPENGTECEQGVEQASTASSIRR